MSLIMYKENECYGHLRHFEGKGVYDPSHGKVDVDPEAVAAHNTTLDQMYIEGLEKNCEVGQGGFFYLTKEKGRLSFQVTTFTGTVVDQYPVVIGKNVTFKRGEKTFKGSREKGSDYFNFERIS